MRTVEDLAAFMEETQPRVGQKAFTSADVVHHAWTAGYEAGQQAILREIAEMPNDRSGQYEGSCFFCGFVLFTDNSHKPDCLWERAQSLTKS